MEKNGITKNYEYALLTNEIYKGWSGMKASEYKKLNLNVAKRGGGVAKGAKDLYEKEIKKSAISKSNGLNYKYIDEQKQIEDKRDGRK